MAQWKATFRDNHDESSFIVVEAPTPKAAHVKARAWFNRQRKPGHYIVEIEVEREKLT